MLASFTQCERPRERSFIDADPSAAASIKTSRSCRLYGPNRVLRFARIFFDHASSVRRRFGCSHGRPALRLIPPPASPAFNNVKMKQSSRPCKQMLSPCRFSGLRYSTADSILLLVCHTSTMGLMNIMKKYCYDFRLLTPWMFPTVFQDDQESTTCPTHAMESW